MSLSLTFQSDGRQIGRLAGLPPFLFASWGHRKFWWVLLLVLNPHWATAQVEMEEMRGLWIVRHRMTSPEAIKKAVQIAKGAGFNALFAQVRGRGDAYYTSNLVPASESLPKKEEMFDPLGLMVKVARGAGLEVHAWVNVFLAWPPTERRPQSATHILRQHPEWFMTSSDGIDLGSTSLKGINLVRRGVEGRYLSPGIPEVRAHIVGIIEELVENYDLNGVHLDYVRYPGTDYDYNLISRAEFVRKHRFDPKELLSDRSMEGSDLLGLRTWNRWRTEQVSILVTEIRKAINLRKPWVRLSAAVKPDFHRAYYQYGQDWLNWINRQTLDFVVPMAYVRSLDSFSSQLRQIQKYVKKGHVYAGIGVYKHVTPAETTDQIAHARRLGLKGVLLFSYDSILEKSKTLDQIRSLSFQLPSHIPNMGWKQGKYGLNTQTR